MSRRPPEKIAGPWGIAVVFMIIVVVLVLIFSFAGCAPETGNVYGKHYHPSYVYATNQCLSHDERGICTFNLPTFHTQPESYELCLDDGKDKGCRTVDKDTYNNYKIGDWYGG